MSRGRRWTQSRCRTQPGCLTASDLLWLCPAPFPVPVRLYRRAIIPSQGAVRGLSGLLVRVLHGRWSRQSQSPTRKSSRGGSASPDREKCCSGSRSPSPSRRADEDCQEEQFSLEFVSFMATLRSLNEVPEAPSESHKMRGFRAAL